MVAETILEFIIQDIFVLNSLILGYSKSVVVLKTVPRIILKMMKKSLYLS